MNHSTDTEAAQGNTHFPHRLACIQTVISRRDTAKGTSFFAQCRALPDAEQFVVTNKSLQFCDLFPKEFSARERVCVENTEQMRIGGKCTGAGSEYEIISGTCWGINQAHSDYY